MKRQFLNLALLASLGVLLSNFSIAELAGKAASRTSNISTEGVEQNDSGNKPAFPVYAEGVQIYQCVDGSGEWKLKEPKATLTDANGNKIGTHFKDTDGPAWQSEKYGKPDSKVVGNSDPAQRTEAKDPLKENIAMLWLPVKSSSGTGMFGNIKSIQRVNTIGGMAPAGACTPNREVSIKYSATYFFYKK